MAELTLEANIAYTITYILSDMTPQYVNSAVVQLFKYGSAIPMKTVSHEAIDTAASSSLTGYFIGLQPDTEYTVHSKVFNSLGQITSDREESIRTMAVDTNVDPYCRHSVIISSKNTYNEWGLIPAERPTIKPPEVKSTFIEIPGTSESVDFTEQLTGRVCYGQSQGSWTFYFDPDWPGGETEANISKKIKGTLWASVYSSLMNYCHGKRHSIALEDDPTTVYSGRLSVSEWNSSGTYSQVTINYNIDPPSSGS